jgi:hypothetical protein
MRIRRSSAVAFVAVSLSLILSRGADAQTREPLQFGLGYQFVHVSIDGNGSSFPFGAYVDVGRTLTSDLVKSWGWMGQLEAGVHHGDGFNEQLYTFLGGIRLTSTKRLKWTPSGYGLIGFGTLNASCLDFCAGADTGVAFQGGVAVATRITEIARAEIGFKATKLKVESGSLFNVAVTAGIRVPLGKH